MLNQTSGGIGMKDIRVNTIEATFKGKPALTESNDYVGGPDNSVYTKIIKPETLLPPYSLL